MLDPRPRVEGESEKSATRRPGRARPDFQDASQPDLQSTSTSKDQSTSRITPIPFRDQRSPKGLGLEVTIGEAAEGPNYESRNRADPMVSSTSGTELGTDHSWTERARDRAED
jgi:hypothetical protein